ncbi:MAG: histone deacetylase [Gemmatimonadota bacterium]|nr:MAG: histone deacetylase [Gemmatimonadota bacterium]
MIKLGGGALRLLRRLRYSLRGRVALLVYHRAYELPVAGVPLDPLRGQRILAYLTDQGVVRPKRVIVPLPASLENISRVHSAEYLERADRPETMEAVLGFRTSDETWQQFIDLQRLATGGTIQATRLALRTGCTTVNVGGGFHHADPDHGMGFCIINDVAVAINRLRHRGFAEPILVIDLDIHDGNGTRVVFAEDPTVYTFSIHNETWDDRAAVADSCIALGSDVSGEEYLAALKEELPRVISLHKPALVLYVAGVDPAADDPVGNWQVSSECLLQRDQFVFQQIRSKASGCATAVLLGGGYGDNAWRHSAGFLDWLFTGREQVPVEDVDAIIRRFRRIETERRTQRRSERRVGADWELDAEDLQLPGMTGRGDARVLGEYTKHGIELQLERLGILNQLRAKGFPAPTLTVDTHTSMGQTIRVFGDVERTELVLELRVRRDRASVPDAELLYVDWLLLQNPRGEFKERPRLPGQEHPGLGLLREIVALLVVICEQLGLDGIIFVPSHYYMAALGRPHLRFLRCADAAVFAAMSDALADLDLAAATQAIADDRLVDVKTGEPIPWHTPQMILPVSKKLKERFDQASSEQAFLRARAALSYELRLAT